MQELNETGVVTPADVAAAAAQAAKDEVEALSTMVQNEELEVQELHRQVISVCVCFCVCVCVCVHIYGYIYTDTHTNISIYIHAYMYRYICICIYTYICTHIHTYIHTYIQAKQLRVSFDT